MHGKPKILFVATVAAHIRGFHLPYLEWFRLQGYETHVACADRVDSPFVDQQHLVPLQRSPFSYNNLKATLMLQQIISKNKFSLIHCHTPMGGVATRLAALGSRKAKIVYTAHGFHFYRGAPLLNWLIYFPVEWLLAAQTDFLITINNEDFATSVCARFPASHIEYVSGVGVDFQRFKPLTENERASARAVLGISTGDRLVIVMAEFNENKNQALLIRAFAKMLQKYPEQKTFLLLAGEGSLRKDCENLAACLGIANRVRFLGYRNDLDQLLPLCDLAVSASYREGLPVNVIEALACGIPVVASDVRGHRDLIDVSVNGLLVRHGPNEVADFATAMATMLYKESFSNAERCRKSVISYEREAVLQQVTAIYRRVIKPSTT